MAPLAGALTVFLGAAGAWLVLRWLGDALNPPGWTAPERVPFAGGKPPRVHAWSRFHVRYYAMALLFLAFDMEMVYMYPWAVVFVREGVTALVEMAGYTWLAILAAANTVLSLAYYARVLGPAYFRAAPAPGFGAERWAALAAAGCAAGLIVAGLAAEMLLAAFTTARLLPGR